MGVKNCLTMRSSRLWKETTARRPCRLEHRKRRRQAAFQFAQLVIHMDAQRLEGAGGGMDGVAQRGGALRLAKRSAASWAVPVTGRAAMMALAMRRAFFSSPSRAITEASVL